MKSIIHLLFFLIACTSSYAQSNQAIVMKYDANGNRTNKKVITLTQTRSLSETQDEEIFENEFIGEKEIRVYPNPTKGQLQIKIIGTSTNLPKTVTLIGDEWFGSDTQIRIRQRVHIRFVFTILRNVYPLYPQWKT